MAGLIPATPDSSGSSRKVVYLVRHAQAMHNLKYKNHSILDPVLTGKGIRQCEDLAISFPTEDANAIELLVTSPLRRAVYTTVHGFPDVIARGVKIMALPEAQETGCGLKPCDTGSDRSVLEEEFQDLAIDLSLVVDGWNLKVDQPADLEMLRARGLLVRRWLRRRPENVIVLVSHGGFLHYLTEDWEGFNEKRGTGWENCEYRAYEFKTPICEEDDTASLVEIESSRRRRLDQG